MIRSAFDELNNPEIVEQVIHEMFHGAGLHGSQPYRSNFWRNNDLNPEVQWADIKKNCVTNFKY